MFHAPDLGLPEDERRLRALRDMAVLDPLPEAEFNRLLELTARAVDAPLAVLILLDGDKLLIKGSYGAEITGSNEDLAICRAVMQQDGLLEIPNSSVDDRLKNHRFVLATPYLRHFAGTVLWARSEPDQPPVAIGLICVFDTRIRSFDIGQRQAFDDAARLTETLLASRAMAQSAIRLANTANQRAIELRRQQRTFRQAERLAMIGSWRLSIETQQVEWSEGVYRIHELEPDFDLNLLNALNFYPPSARDQVRSAIANTIETGAPFHCEVDFETARGRPLRVRSMGEVELQDGKPVALTGLFQDITDRHRMEQSLRRSASIDEVTRIGNRAAFNRELEAAMATARQDGSPLTLVLIDLDAFKALNDNHGHVAGDDILRAIGRRLRAAHLGKAFAARLGGDEFALIIHDPETCATIEPVVERLLADLKKPVHTGEGLLPVSGTIGYAEFGPLIASQREFVHRADTALYEAKRIERGTARKFSGLLFRPGGNTRVSG